jgi:hypothetical protein
MRQRRQRLQVSTFPFLAVLLCAMGSLILLLLVMDRRAKVVARAKALRAMEQASAQATAEDQKAAAAHRAEWERRRQMLHEQLQQQDQQILGQLQGIQKQMMAATTGVQTELARGRDLQERLQAERLELTRSEDESTARRAEVGVAAQQADASRTELARLTADLERMERCIADLKTARQRQSQMVSLVPYRGKHGDNRKPIYIECGKDDLIFHPDRLALRGATGAAIRDEIERRLARQRSDTKLINQGPQDNAYLLMLIRPNGIATYYQTLAALKGLRVDFGYEFIDHDWVLDFSEDDDTPKKQPWMSADRVKEKQPSGPSAKGLPSSGTALGRPMGIPASAPTGSGNPMFGSNGSGANPRGVFATASSAGRRGDVQPAAGQRGSGIPGLGTRDGTEPSFADVAVGGGRFPDARGAVLDGNPVTASHAGAGQGEPFASRGGATEGNEPSRSVSDSKSGTRAQAVASRVAAGNGTTENQREGTPGEIRKPGLDAPPSLLPPSAANRSSATENSGFDASQGTASQRASDSSETDLQIRPTSPTQGRSSSGESLRGPAGDLLDRLGPQNPTQKPVGTKAIRPGPLIGNRDWIIPIECTADAVVLFPSRQRIATTQLSKGENGSNPLREAIQQMITRRQATVRPGEPPYRPMIRFRVLSDGLRSYHLAYPALEALRVPMTRENVDPEETKAARGTP